MLGVRVGILTVDMVRLCAGHTGQSGQQSERGPQGVGDGVRRVTCGVQALEVLPRHVRQLLKAAVFLLHVCTQVYKQIDIRTHTRTHAYAHHMCMRAHTYSCIHTMVVGWVGWGKSPNTGQRSHRCMVTFGGAVLLTGISLLLCLGSTQN